MIKDLFLSFKDNLKTKTTNPFFGTLIIVWIIHNWRLMYSIFNFDNNVTLDSRIEFISKYLDTSVFVFDLLICIIVSFGVLTITYLLLNLSRLIVNFSEKVITPKVYKWTDISSVVLKQDFENIKEERNRYERKFEQEREAKLKLQNDYEKLESRLQNLLSEKPVNAVIKAQQTDSKIIKLKELLNNQETLSAFRDIVDVVLNKKFIPDTKMTNLMLRLNLVEKGTSDHRDYYTYSLTEDGKKLREFLIDYDLPSYN